MRSNPQRRFPALSLAVVAVLLLSTVPMPVGAAPSITGVSPNSATTNGGIEVTIQGTGFDAKSVTFGGTSATITSQSPLKVIVPPRANSGLVNVVVTNQDDTSAVFTNGFTYADAAAPTITEVDPTADDTNGGVTVTVNGRNFFKASAAGAVGIGPRVGGIIPSNIQYFQCGVDPDPDTICRQLTFEAPAHSIGAKDIVIINPDGKTVTRANGFTYTEANSPSFASSSPIDPIQGTAAGGDEITLSGANFAQGAVVRIGGTIASVNTPMTSSSITVVSPPHAQGTVDVTVTNPNGQVATLPNSFTYNPLVPPTLNTAPVSPASGPITGGSLVTVGGSGFHRDAQFTFDGVPAAFVSVAQDGTSAQVVTPPHAAGDVSVRVTNPDGKTAVRSPTSTNPVFTYVEAVRIISIPSNEASRNGGTVITINGQGFVQGAKVYFVHGTGPNDMVEALGATLGSQGLAVTVPPSIFDDGFDDECYLTVGSNCRYVDIRVENPSGAEAWLRDGFAYKQAAAPAFATNPFCTTASGTCTAPPASATSENGGQTIYIRGTNFHTNPKPTVRYGACSNADCPEEATVGTVQSTAIQVTVPPRAAGAGTVTLFVENPGGQEIDRTFTYTDGAAVTISASSTPAGSGSQNGGNTITISGTGFHTSPKPTVTFGGTEATVGTVTSTTIQVTVPPRSTAGVVTVVVKNPGGNEASTTYTYTGASAPTVTEISQTSGSILGGSSLTITGTNFHANPKPTVEFVRFVANPNDPPTEAIRIAAAVGTVSATSIQATVPAAPWEDGYSIIVTNPSGQSTCASPSQTSPFCGAASRFTYTAGAAPQVTSVSPTTGRGGTELTITGSNFARPGPDDDPNFPPRPLVFVAGTQVPTRDVTPVSGTSIRIIVPEVTPGTHTITVTNPGGLSGSIGNAFTVPTGAGTPPSLDSVACGTFTTNGGDAQLTGSDLAAGAAVLFGDTLGRITATSGATGITARAPAFATSGERTVTVVNPDGQSVGIFGACDFKADVAPLLETWAFTAGPASGGTLVTINGQNFVDGTTARFGTFAATHVEFVSATEVKVRTPAHTSGVADLTIVNPDGKTASVSNAFGFVGVGGPAAATVTAVSPNSGPSLGGTSVTITGTGFQTGATVTFGGTAATSVVVSSATSITATTPAHAAGAVDVAVTNPGASAGTLANGFTYTASPAPTVTSVAPTSGSTNGGTSVTITGTNFANGATVTFGGTAATSVTFTSATSLTAVSPARSTAGAVNVVVKNPDNQEGTLSNGFTYEAAPAPTVTSLSPTQGPSVGGTSVTITGTGFANGAKVTFGGRESTTVAVASNGNSLTATTPGHPAGQVAVVVTNPDDQSGTLSNAFTYTASPAPTISSVTPTSGPTAGGTSITIVGTNFASGATVRVGGAAATDVTVTATQITARTPAGTAGAKTVQVINPDDQTASLNGAFTYGSSSTPTPAQIEAANERLQDSVDVSREDGDNVITYSLSGISPDPVGIQVWRSTSPFAVIATLDGADARSGEYVDAGAPQNAYYILTVFYSRDAAGGFVSALADAPGYEGTSEDEQKGMAATIPDSGGSTWWIWVIVAVAVLAVVVVVIVAVANRRREPEVYDRDVGWVDKEWSAPTAEDEATHRITCPRCSTTFEATGQRPLTTHCPNCGVKGTLT